MAGSLASCDDQRKSKGHGRLPSNLAESCVRPLELEEAIDILRHFIVQQGDDMRELREATFEKPLNELVDGQVFE